MSEKVVCVEAKCKNCRHDFLVKKIRLIPRYPNIRVCLHSYETSQNIFGRLVRVLKKTLCNNIKNRQSISEFIQECKAVWNDQEGLVEIYCNWVEIEWII